MDIVRETGAQDEIGFSEPLTIHDLDFMDGYIDELQEFGLSDNTYNEVKQKIKEYRIKLKQ